MASHKNTKENNKLSKPFNNYLKYSSLAIQMVATIGLMGFLGFKIDQWLGLVFPVFLLAFTFLSLGVIIYQLIKSLKEEDGNE